MWEDVWGWIHKGGMHGVDLSYSVLCDQQSS
jgi:hypothetical protein